MKEVARVYTEKEMHVVTAIARCALTVVSLTPQILIQDLSVYIIGKE